MASCAPIESAQTDRLSVSSSGRASAGCCGAPKAQLACHVQWQRRPVSRIKGDGKMKSLKPQLAVFTALAIGMLVGCSTTSSKSADVSAALRKSLDQAGFKTVSIDQDRDKGVVVLGGHVPSESSKSQAESIAKSIAGDQVVSDQILVIPPGAESDTKAMNSDLDKGIANNLDAALIQNTLQKNVKYDVKNGVVTLTGEVDSQPRAAQAGTIASSVPNVLQVVNEVQVKDQKATSSR
jgi:osmotically-inducible protein OsmY